MPSTPRRRTIGSLAAVAVPLVAIAAVAVHPRPASARSTSPDSPTRVIVQTLPHGAASTPRFGRRVRLSRSTQRVFFDATLGYALATVRGQAVPVRTTDGGRTWRIDGPGLFDVGAAQAAITVDALGTGNRSTVFAYGGSNAVDISTDGGRVWRRAIFSGAADAAAATTDGGSVAVWVDFQRLTLRFVTADGGRDWRVATGQG